MITLKVTYSTVHKNYETANRKRVEKIGGPLQIIP